MHVLFKADEYSSLQIELCLVLMPASGNACYISYKPFSITLDSRTPTEVTPLATARIKACCFHFSRGVAWPTSRRNVM